MRTERLSWMPRTFGVVIHGLNRLRQFAGLQSVPLIFNTALSQSIIHRSLRCTHLSGAWYFADLLTMLGISTSVATCMPDDHFRIDRMQKQLPYAGCSLGISLFVQRLEVALRPLVYTSAGAFTNKTPKRLQSFQRTEGFAAPESPITTGKAPAITSQRNGSDSNARAQGIRLIVLDSVSSLC